ncbi:acyl-CoA N-acyltransferase [Umbelopsis sp. PMI_123]|nr:acyl-CoA N-acyltransferase [Umbelopsis sp. PMI_123]
MAPTVTTSRIALGDLTPNNIGQLRALNSTLFPVNYSDKFYKEVLEVGEFAKLAYFNDVCVGAVCCRVEPVDTNENTSKLYIMTLGVLKPYRHLGIGRKLLDHILEHAATTKEHNITSVYLHVQTTNQEALSFYKNQGFEITGTTTSYYKNIDDKDAHVLSKPIQQ